MKTEEISTSEVTTYFVKKNIINIEDNYVVKNSEIYLEEQTKKQVKVGENEINQNGWAV